MRTAIDIPDADLSLLTKLSAVRRVSRSELVRSAISFYLQSHSPELTDRAFGLWSDKKEDGLAYQERMRSDW